MAFPIGFMKVCNFLQKSKPQANLEIFNSRGNFGNKHCDLDVERWSSHALRSFQRFERNRTKVPVVRIGFRQRKSVSRDKILKVTHKG